MSLSQVSGPRLREPQRPARSLAVERGRIDLTWVELVWVEGRIERWIRFGQPVEDRILDRRTRLVAFAPGTLFGFVRWSREPGGAVASRIDVLRAVPRGRALSTIPGVTPGADSLLRLLGWPVVKRALDAIDAVEAQGFDPTAVAPDWWRHVHNRLIAGETPRPYAPDRHRAWTLRREDMS